MVMQISRSKVSPANPFEKLSQETRAAVGKRFVTNFQRASAPRCVPTRVVMLSVKVVLIWNVSSR